ncbi:MAG: hypothetical protein JJU34_17730 [Lunatimonas sp.]|uniref:FISUMP domain-containing protein n=1 Tax=Lunatimonas sp. TaxID=2060141 RepID=UPI00263A405C|nr:FISUMP domain-containing protein [Lunatimonas sp.]MCC5939124.1 hypothetical protein [Lunatimonas sp.]
MRKLLFLLLYILIFWSCKQLEDEQQVTPMPTVRVPPNDQTVLVPLRVANNLSFTNTLVYTSVDSLESSRIQEGVFFPKDRPSFVIVLDQGSNDVLAFVKKDSLSSEVELNARNVSMAMLGSVPAVNGLEESIRDEALQALYVSSEFSDFEQFIGGRLGTRTPIYQESDTFADLLLEMNRFLLENYFEVPDFLVESANLRIDYADWLNPEEGGTMVNNEYSFVEVVFTSGDLSHSAMLQPRGMIGTLFTPTTKPIAGLNLLDGCYAVRFTQESDEAISKNLQMAIEKLVILVAGEVFSSINSHCKSALLGQLYGDLTPFVSQVFSGQIADVNEAITWISSNLTDIIGNLLVEGISSEECLNAIGWSQALLALTKEQVKTANLILKVGSVAYNVAQIAPFVSALMPRYQLEFSVESEIYFGSLYRACISANHLDPTLRFEGKAGESITPGVLMLERSSFGGWNRSGFRVNWIVEEGNGVISESTSTTDSEGRTRITWSFPEDFDGVARLVAEVRNKEGGQVHGSPLEFFAEVEPSMVFIDPRDDRRYPVLEIGSQTWLGRNLNYFGVESDCFENDPTNCRDFGRMYDWESALIACPPGWHLPNDTEWLTLITFAGGLSNAGKTLRSTFLWGNNSTQNGTNEYGFNLLPGGYYFDGMFGGMGNTTLLWSATPMDPQSHTGNRPTASAVFFQSGTSVADLVGIRTNSGWLTGSKFYCRCIKDD